MSLSHNLTTSSAQDALDTANDLLGSLNGTVKKHPSLFVSIGEADFIPNVCQYTSPYGLTLLAKPAQGESVLDTLIHGDY